MNSLWESRYIWLPMEIDDKKKTLDVVWHDIYDLDMYVSISLLKGNQLLIGCLFSETGEWEAVEGETYYAKDATTEGDAFKQEAVSSF